MSAAVTLLMAMHCHQPVGNFGFVFEEAYAKAYEPFLGVLERHPGVQLTLHYSGCLLDWLRQHRPEFLRRVRALVARRQVEVLASGYYEPILPLIPEADRQAQIARMRQALREDFGTEASGLWLTERVWEPDLPATLARAGIRYTLVDTNQFAGARDWLPRWLQLQDGQFWDLLGSYATEYAGCSVMVFPASKRLRYWMPFQPVEQTIGFLKGLPGRLSAIAGAGRSGQDSIAITFADDGEKFGLWPKTHRWVYEEGWLDQFFSALERERAWLATSTFYDYVERAHPDGRVYLPCGSYEEMLEWSGGHFRNFFAKYPEANAMQQKMLRVSWSIAKLKAEGSRPKAVRAKPPASSLQPPARKQAWLRQAETELYAGQCNCAYWHGVFGGLYLSHLRRAVYAHLIAAEELAGRAGDGSVSVTAVDADGDGQEEAYVRTADMSLVIDPDEGGTVTEWNLFGPRVNVLDTLSRRPEPYHEKLKVKELHAVAAGTTPASIHDLIGVKERNLAQRLIYDDHRRSAFIDYGLQRMPSLQEVVHSTWSEQQQWAPGSFHWQRSRRMAASRPTGPLEVILSRAIGEGCLIKTIRVFADRPSMECVYTLEGMHVPVVGLEFNVSLRDERYLTTMGQREGVSAFDIEEPAAQASLCLSLDPPATVLHFPIETVSESEEGLERTYQGLCLVCLWELRGASPWAARVRWSVAVRPPTRRTASLRSRRSRRR